MDFRKQTKISFLLGPVRKGKRACSRSVWSIWWVRGGVEGRGGEGMGKCRGGEGKRGEV